MAVRLSALRAGRPLPPGRFLVLISIRGWANPRAIVRLEGLGQLINPITSSGIEPACNIVPQPTTLPRVPTETDWQSEILSFFRIFLKFADNTIVNRLVWGEFVSVGRSESAEFASLGVKIPESFPYGRDSFKVNVLTPTFTGHSL
jgi:hypothetical protein